MNFYSLNRLLISTFVAIFSTCITAYADVQPVDQNSIHKKLMELETSANGRIGISVINTENNQQIEYRAAERFPMGSTFKVMLVATILKQSMTDDQLLQQKIKYTKEDIATWSPVTEKHIADGMTISELCAATIMYSDNTAGNLLMKQLGGAEPVMAFARSIGDDIYNLKSGAAELKALPGDFDYTTTPAAMEKSLQQLIFGNALGLQQREQLLNWMKDNTTGDQRIRAGTPKTWVVADKTGSGDYGLTNDIGILYPPKCKPIIATVYFVQNKKEATGRADIVASATRLIINELAQTDQCIKNNL
jgi:beta-lactamase class A